MRKQTETVSRVAVLAEQVDGIGLIFVAERWVAAVVLCNGIKVDARSNRSKDAALLAAIRGAFAQHNGGQGIEEAEVVAIRDILVESCKVVVSTEKMPYVGNGKENEADDQDFVLESAGTA